MNHNQALTFIFLCFDKTVEHDIHVQLLVKPISHVIMVMVRFLDGLILLHVLEKLLKFGRKCETAPLIIQDGCI